MSNTNEANRWNSVSAGWHDYIPWMRAWYQPATDLMFKLAGLQSGSRVLDVAAGDGDQTLAAAEIVGKQGYVLATDIAEDLLAYAEQTAKDGGYDQVETRLMDGSQPDVDDDSFDAVICRFALMYFPDPEETLRAWGRALRAGGHAAVVVYGPSGSPEFTTAHAAVRDHLGLPEVLPAATSLGSPGVLKAHFERAGYQEVTEHPLTLPVRMDSVDACVGYLQNTSPTLKGLIGPLSPDEQSAAWDAIAQALEIYKTPDGFEVQHRVVVVGGHIP